MLIKRVDRYPRSVGSLQFTILCGGNLDLGPSVARSVPVPLLPSKKIASQYSDMRNNRQFCWKKAIEIFYCQVSRYVVGYKPEKNMLVELCWERAWPVIQLCQEQLFLPLQICISNLPRHLQVLPTFSKSHKAKV